MPKPALLLTALLVGLLLSSSLRASSPGDEAQTHLDRALDWIDRDLDESQAAIERALELAPANADIQFACGRIMGRQAEEAFLRALRYAGRSLRCLQRAVELRPDHIPYRRGLMAFYLGAPGIAGGDEALALEQVEAIEALDPAQGLLARVDFYRSTDSKNAASDLLVQGRERFPAMAALHLQHGLLLQEDGQFESAHQAFEQGRSLLDSAADAGQMAQAMNALYQIGRNSLFSETRVEAGIEALQAYVRLELPSSGVPEREWAYLRLAQLHLLNNDQREAARCAEQARRLDDRQLRDALARLDL